MTDHDHDMDEQIRRGLHSAAESCEPDMGRARSVLRRRTSRPVSGRATMRSGIDRRWLVPALAAVTAAGVAVGVTFVPRVLEPSSRHLAQAGRPDTSTSSHAPSDGTKRKKWPSGLSREEEARLLGEQEARFLSCLSGEGIRVDPYEMGPPWRIDPGELDDETFSKIQESCSRRSGPEPEIVPYTPKELSALYDLNLEAKKCLEARGATVREPPSREKWIEDFHSADGTWSPFDHRSVALHVEACPDPDVYDVYGIDLYDSE